MPFLEGDIREVTYDSSNHISILCQSQGSLWKKVVPYCLLNVAITVVLFFLRDTYGVDLGIADKGHSMMAMIVAFLLVSRASITIGRFMELRSNLAKCYKATSELCQTMVVVTQYKTKDEDKEWREEVSHRMLLLLRVTMAVLDYKSSGVHAWDAPELSEEEREYLQRGVTLDNDAFRKAFGKDRKLVPGQAGRWAHGKRSLRDENLRVPGQMALRVRRSIVSSRERLGGKLPEEAKLLGFVDEFMSGFAGLRKIITTPFPFPLVQMGRTFLFFYVYTLPFALLKYAVEMPAFCFIIFIITYGFIGLEYVSIELDDPFGNDANDFDNTGMAYTVFEDVYATIYDQDGLKYADMLREKMQPRKVHEGNGYQNGNTEQSWLLDEKV